MARTAKDKTAPEVKPKTIRKFHARGSKSIEERMVESETETMVIIGYDRYLERVIRYKKVSVEEGWFDTWEEAHAFLQARMEKDVTHAELVLRVTKEAQAELLAMKPPAASDAAC